MAKPQPQLANEPSAWGRTEWAPADLGTAWRLAQGGNLSLAAELAEATLADDRVQATLGTRIRGLLGLPLAFEPPNNREGRTITRALEADFWAFAPEESLYQLVAWGLLLGVGLARLDWQEGESGRVLPVLEVWHPRNLRYDPQRGVWQVQTREGGMVEPRPGAWWLYTPYGARRPWSHGLWRALAVPWLVKQDAVRYWARDNEVGALRVGQASGPTTAEAREQLARDLADLGNSTGIALPEGYSLQILSPSGDVWQSKQAAIEWANTALTTAILGQNLTTEVRGGSFAAARVHDAVRRDLLEADAEGLSTSMREQVLSYWAEFNYGDARLAPWPRWDTDLPEDTAQNADTLSRLAQAVATLAQAGAPVDVPALLERYDVPLQPPQAGLVRLASGNRVALSSGFFQGQLYADRLADNAREAGATSMRPILARVLEAIDQAEGYDALRARLLELFPSLNPDDLARLMENALILADLAGRYAVRSDVEG
jgi:phage gp29-like protein